MPFVSVDILDSSAVDLNLHLLGRKTRRAPEGKGILDYFILLLCMLEICHQNLLHRT